MNYIVKTENLTKCYGKTASVNQLDLKVPEKCIYGFLGPNGAGKSTTMKMLLNLIKPTEGSVELFGTKVNDSNRLRILKNTGSLIESPSYYGHLTGRENLEIVQLLRAHQRKKSMRYFRLSAWKISRIRRQTTTPLA